MEKNIVIFGGTFNPIHNGHIIALQTIMNHDDYDEVWLMPSGTPPFKLDQADSKEDRLAMCHIVAGLIEELTVSEFEIHSEEVSYTYRTWLQLVENNPESHFHWVIGYDHLWSIESWQYATELMENVSFIVMNRGGENHDRATEQMYYLEKKYGFSYTVVRMPTIELSSTTVRKRVAEGKSILGYVPESVISYIKENKLYI